MKEYHTWSVDEMALLIYANYKGLSNDQLAQLFGCSRPAITAKKWHIRHPEGDSQKLQKMIDKAGQLEYRVRSGEAPDQRAMWDRRISEINGINYLYTDKPTVNEEVTQQVTKTFDNYLTYTDQPDPSEPVVKLSTILEVRVNLEALNKLVELLK